MSVKRSATHTKDIPVGATEESFPSRRDAYTISLAPCQFLPDSSARRQGKSRCVEPAAAADLSSTVSFPRSKPDCNDAESDTENGTWAVDELFRGASEVLKTDTRGKRKEQDGQVELVNGYELHLAPSSHSAGHVLEQQIPVRLGLLCGARRP